MKPAKITSWLARLPLLVVLTVIGLPSAALASSDSAGKAKVAASQHALAAGKDVEAVRGLTDSARSGEPRAALDLGIAYDTGHGVGQDFVQALAWFEIAAQMGNADASYRVGAIYEIGRGVTADHAIAAGYYARAAALGNRLAQYRLGLLYKTGDGVPRNQRLASLLFREAAANGAEPARLDLTGKAKPSGASHNVSPAAFARAQRSLLTRMPGEAAKAAAVFRQAAQAGDPLAAYDLGYCYETGTGLAPDPEAAIRWYGQAARTTKDKRLLGLAAIALAAVARRLGG
jgi:TPR repeat protein